ncbi:MAG: adenosylcobinamide-GDP ribazoletransferase [Pseudomonadota bacterium]
MISSLMRALGFLSRIPVPDRHFAGGQHSAAHDAGMYPLAGVVVALPGTIILAVCGLLGAPALVSATLAVASLIAITGALHEDGLGDVADGFFATHDPERILTIMRDPHLGTFGTLALVIGAILRIAALAAVITGMGAVAAGLFLLATAAISRAAMIWHWAHLPNARKNGKAAAAGQPDNATMTTALLWAAVITVICAFATGAIMQTVLATGTLATCAWFFARLAERRIGGHTGDTIGATQQLSEIAFLTALAITLPLPTFY